MARIKYHVTMLGSVGLLALILATPVLGSEHGESLEGIDWLGIISMILEWFAVLLEQSAKGVRQGVDLLLEMFGEESSA